MATIPETEFRRVLEYFGPRSFTTKEFIDRLTTAFPSTWKSLKEEYGSGGKGAGTRYSAFSRVSQVLEYWSKRGELDKLDYEAAPPDWGSPVIRRWTLDRAQIGGQLYPDEIRGGGKYEEGAKTQVTVNRYERDPSARQKCIEHWGLTCRACTFDFERAYGPHGAGFIHVHHLKPLHEIGQRYQVDPINDLIPVCPNCHSMIHRRTPALTIEELQALIFKNSGNAISQ